MRTAMLRIQTYDDNGDIAGIVKEMVTFLRLIIFFDNVYLDPAAATAQTTLNTNDDDNTSSEAQEKTVRQDQPATSTSSKESQFE